ncbi:AI-2E family transporter [Rhodocytophaga aerolata]|uniref:AI-2E family transporter n=1 Tax=Rhodocytophaga aerolata TaxID=455078 RepID=A0ABT8REY1_9BACT|nr:AI-2E family transporter [Rhodocytophaga aerolata]MDO1450659.1 AI-2E family transporter [Rhodocytophaga aerolata]
MNDFRYKPSSHSSYSFPKRVMIGVGIALIFILIILLIGYAFHVVLLILAGSLIAVLFRGASSALSSWIPIPQGWSLAIVLAGFIGFFVLAYFLLAPQVSEQATTLSEELPKAYDKFKGQLEDTPWGNRLTDQIPDRQTLQENQGSLLKKGFGVFSSTFGVLADIYVILFIGIFFTAQPALYTQGIVKLFPQDKRARAGEVIHKTGATLFKWILGKLFSMVMVGILTAIGLSLLGIPMALALGVLAGLLSFIPNFGPIIALIPAALIALVEGPSQAFYVVALYMGIQAVESNVLTPFVEKKMVEIPPALVIISQVLMGVFTGVMGLILATPIMVVLLVLIKMVYIQDVLGDESVEVND